MQKNLYLFLLLLLVGVVACNTQKAVSPIVVDDAREPDTLSLPAFSGEVLYLFGREYMAIYDSLSPKYHNSQSAQIRAEKLTMAAYLERRLQDWYPEVAYKGMINNWYQVAMRLANITPQQLQLFINREVGGMRMVQGREQTESHAINSDINEMITLSMTQEECAVFNNLNNLAMNADFAQKSSLPNASYAIDSDSADIFSPDIIDSFDRENILASLMLAGGPYALYRVLLSKQRAEMQAKAYFGVDTNRGKRGDAFKHMYVNMLLRAYTSQEIATYVMDDVWEKVHVNTPADRYMDLHNNQIGRQLRYWNFHENTSDWRIWAENVYNFVQDSTQASFKHWNQQTPEFNVLYDVRQTPSKQYIYWNKETTPSVEKVVP